MKFRGLIPMIRTPDLADTIDFYVENLGFKRAECSEEWGWAVIARDSVSLMIALPNEHMPFSEPAFTGSFYIRVDDVDSLWKSVRNKLSICYPLEDFPYGMREFAAFDNNGYLLQFGQPVPQPSEA